MEPVRLDSLCPRENHQSDHPEPFANWIRRARRLNLSVYHAIDLSGLGLVDTDLLLVEQLLDCMPRCRLVDVSFNAFDGQATDFYTSTLHKAVWRLRNQRKIQLVAQGHVDLFDHPTRLDYPYTYGPRRQ